jgi:hypothetical protein
MVGQLRLPKSTRIATGSSVLLCRDRLKEEREEKCLEVSDDAPMLHSIPHSPMNFFRTLAMVGLVGVGNSMDSKEHEYSEASNI